MAEKKPAEKKRRAWDGLFVADHSRTMHDSDGNKYRFERGQVYRVHDDTFREGIPTCFSPLPAGSKIPEQVGDGRTLVRR